MHFRRVVDAGAAESRSPGPVPQPSAIPTHTESSLNETARRPLGKRLSVVLKNNATHVGHPGRAVA